MRRDHRQRDAIHQRCHFELCRYLDGILAIATCSRTQGSPGEYLPHFMLFVLRNRFIAQQFRLQSMATFPLEK